MSGSLAPVPQVSVVLPLFGDHRAIDWFPVICRAWLEQDVPCEVVVAVADGTKVPPLAGERVRVLTAGRDLMSPGPLRNLGVSASRSPLLYLTDGDVAPLGADFLGHALALLDDRAVVQPWMYRLVNPDDVVTWPPFERPGPGRACHVCFDARGRLVALGGERFSWRTPEMLEVTPPPGVGWRKDDGTPWLAFPFHWGGILVRRETFDAVGSYCARYVGWGCEDDDLITKLAGRAGIIRAWKEAPRQLACLHFEHPRTHESAHIKANLAIQADRLTAGVDAMIEEDR